MDSYEMNLSNKMSSVRDYYSQTQRNIQQNPMVLNPEPFNNSNNANQQNINLNNSLSQEKLKDVIINFI